MVGLGHMFPVFGSHPTSVRLGLPAFVVGISGRVVVLVLGVAIRHSARSMIALRSRSERSIDYSLQKSRLLTNISRAAFDEGFPLLCTFVSHQVRANGKRMAR